MNALEEKQVSTQTYYENSFLKVTEDDVILPDGKEAKRVSVLHPGGVNLVALDENGCLLLVEQYRYPVGRNTLETPAGKIEPGEETILTAKRELEEETGYTCEHLVPIGRFATSPGFCNEYIENFLVEGISLLDYEVAGDEDEFLNLYRVSKEEALAYIESGFICDFKTIYAIQYLISHKGW